MLDRDRLGLALGLALAGVTAMALGACDRPPSDDGLRDWTPADHDRAEESQRAQSGQQAPQAPRRREGDGGSDRAADLAAIVDLTWRQQCAQCHGLGGHGDGPTGPMVKAPDLTQIGSRVSDGDIAAIITNGKGQMPKFDLSEPVVRGLVARVRALGSGAGGGGGGAP